MGRRPRPRLDRHPPEAEGTVKRDWSRELRQAKRDMERNAARIASGETYRAQQKTSRKPSSKTDGKRQA